MFVSEYAKMEDVLRDRMTKASKLTGERELGGFDYDCMMILLMR